MPMAMISGPPAVLDTEQRHQGEDAAFAVVVGLHDDSDILDRRDDHQVQMISDSMPSAASGASLPPDHAIAVEMV